MKKLCVIFFNCHGCEIEKHLLSSIEFNNIYDIKFIPLYDYLFDGYKYSNNDDLIEDDKKLIINCDLIILQHIKNYRKIIHHEYIKSLIKLNCKIITISHYTFSGYNYPHNILNDEFINENKSKYELETYINNLFLEDKEKIIIHLNNELNHIKNLDENSDIKCYDFVKNNYDKHLLFYSRSYPTYILFHYISSEILKILNINDIIKPIWSSYASHCLEPIYPNIKKYLELKFELPQFNLKCNIIEYLICCKLNNTNSLNLKNRHDEGRKHCKSIQEIISSKKYR